MLTIQQAISLSAAKTQGSQLTPAQEVALSTFMKHTPNLELILMAGLKQPAFMLSYKLYTQSDRKSGQYFKSAPDPLNMILYMLSILCGAPDRLSQHQSNVYLALEGQLLAWLIQMEQEATHISQYMEKVLSLNTIEEIKYHFVLKILASCLEETVRLAKRESSESIFRMKTIKFALDYAPFLINFIDRMALDITEKFHEFYDPFLLISNLIEAQFLFLTAMNRYHENEHSGHSCSFKFKLLKWEERSLILWVKQHCQYMARILNLHNAISEQALKKEPANPTICLTIILHIYQLSIEQRRLQNQQFNKKVGEVIIQKFLNPFFYEFKQKHLESLNFITLGNEFHVLVLKMLTSTDYFLKQSIKSLQQNSQAATKYDQIQAYAIYATSLSIEYVDYCECPVGLSVKLMYMLAQQTRQHLLPNIQPKQEIAFFEHVEKMYENFFLWFMFCRLANKKNDDSSIFQEDTDWSTFIPETLNAYFDDLIEFVPDCFSSTQVVEGMSRVSQFHSKMDSNKFHSIGRLENEDERLRIVDIFQQFEKDDVFKMLAAFLFLITWPQTSQLKEQSDQEHFIEDSPEERLELKEDELLAIILPKLGCFVAIIKRLRKHQIRAFFFYELYHASRALKTHICRLYLLQQFMGEIIPDEFSSYGEDASITYTFIYRQFGAEFDSLVIGATLAIVECLQKNDQFVIECPEVVNYGLSILQSISKSLTERVKYLKDNQEPDRKYASLRYQSILRSIFCAVKNLQIDCLLAYRKVFAIAAYFIDLNGVTALYNFYEKLTEQTLDIVSLQTLKTDQGKLIQKYLSGATGILEGLSKAEIFGTAAELILTDIYYLKKNKIFCIDEELMEIETDFLNCLLCEKIYSNFQNGIGLSIHDLFYEDLQYLIYMAHETDYEKDCMGLYAKMTKTNDIYPLAALPAFVSMTDYPDVLSEYFSNIPRVSDLSQLEPYASSRLEWFVHFLGEKIERGEKYDFDVQKMFLKFRMDKLDKLEKLIFQTSFMISLPAEMLKERIAAEFNKFDSLEISKTIFENTFDEENN